MTATMMRNPDGRESLTVCDRDEWSTMENSNEHPEFTQNAICAVKSKFGEWIFGERQEREKIFRFKEYGVLRTAENE